ncbi:hypothetical protein Lepto7375DRAFT_3327 [Leptolyngbya sp. PCC 7375]|nr:hypothetical protein Lepto7375DRAFT_3327 [Leptolyngbya sp. PCC 7375]
MISFNSEHLRLIWSMVETYSYILEGLSDEAICLWLLKKIKDNIHLSHDETNEIRAYIRSRSHLIREVANNQPLSDNVRTKQFSNTHGSKRIELPYNKAI